jgi:hypothetical protein
MCGTCTPPADPLVAIHTATAAIASTAAPMTAITRTAAL